MTTLQDPRRERRLYPRVTATFPVQLTLDANGDLHTFDSRAVNISLGSMQVEGNGEIVMAFQAQKTLPHTGMLNFTLPGGRKTVSVRCQLLNTRRLSQHAYTLALSYGAIDPESEEIIREYVRTQC